MRNRQLLICLMVIGSVMLYILNATLQTKFACLYEISPIMKSDDTRRTDITVDKLDEIAILDMIKKENETKDVLRVGNERLEPSEPEKIQELNAGIHANDQNNATTINVIAKNQMEPDSLVISSSRSSMEKLADGSETEIGVGSPSQKKYLLPIQYLTCGPNVQYNHFKAALRMSLYQNRTIVEIPFATLGSQPRKDLTGLRNFNETFDMEELHTITDTVTMDTFKKECNNKLDAVLMAASKEHVDMADVKYHYVPHIKSMKWAFGIDIPEFSEAETPSVFYADGLSPPASDKKCLGIFMMYSFVHVNKRDDAMKTKIATHLVRAKKIRETASKAVNQICGGKPYLAVHWRNKTGETCRGLIHRSTCSIELPIYNENAERTIPDILDLMKQYQLGCVYAAFPEFSTAYGIILRQSTIPNVFDFDSVINMNVSEDLIEFMKDKYMMSLVEQEICQHAEVFLYTWQSNWSSFITHLRDEDGKQSIALEHLPSWKPVPKF